MRALNHIVRMWDRAHARVGSTTAAQRGAVVRLVSTQDKIVLLGLESVFVR